MEAVQIIIIAVSAVAVGFLAYFIIKSMIAPKRVEGINKLIKQGKTAAAVKLAKSIIARNQRDYKAHYYLGKAYLADNKPELALMEFKVVNQNVEIIFENEDGELDEIFEDFCNNNEGYIYELRIREEEYCEQRFVCSSYEAALKYIDLYYDEYASIGVAETEKSRYHIVKRRIYSGKADEGFCEDGAAECILGAGKKVLSVEDTRPICNKSDEIETVCDKCNFICPLKNSFNLALFGRGWNFFLFSLKPD